MSLEHVKKPIWTTEFSIVDWAQNPPPINNDFISVAINRLETRDYVVEYSWFLTTVTNDCKLLPMSLYDPIIKDLSVLGKCYFWIV